MTFYVQAMMTYLILHLKLLRYIHRMFIFAIGYFLLPITIMPDVK